MNLEKKKASKNVHRLALKFVSLGKGSKDWRGGSGEGIIMDGLSGAGQFEITASQ